MLAKEKVPVSSRDSFGRTPFYYAAMSGNVPMLPLLHTPDENIEQRDAQGLTPFLCVCGRGLVQVAKFYAEHGANVKALAEGEKTALHLAAEGRGVKRMPSYGDRLEKADFPGMIKLLLQLGLSLEARDSQGVTPPQVAFRSGRREVLEAMGSPLAGQFPKESAKAAREACSKGDLEAVKRIVEAGFEIDQDVGEGYTLLHWACQCNQPDIMRYLISRGASIESLRKDKTKDFCLLKTAVGQVNSVACTAVLLDAGADVTDIRPYHLAITDKGNGPNALELVKLFLSKGVSPNLYWCHISPLQFACKFKLFPVIEELLKAGATFLWSELDKKTGLPKDVPSEVKKLLKERNLTFKP
jgi:ankyrin repeat protein